MIFEASCVEGMARHPDEVTAVALVDPDEAARKARAAEFDEV